MPFLQKKLYGRALTFIDFFAVSVDKKSMVYIMNIYIKTNGNLEVGTLDIIIRNTGDQPIYDQIYSQIKNLIIAGKLKEGDLLPSIRGLAKDLRISVITTKRAYEELEREGFIYSVTGKGSFVAGKNTELIREANLRKIEEHMTAIYELAQSCNMSRQDLMEMFTLIGEE